MKPIEILKKWIDCFNASDVAGIVALYADNAVNHQVANAPVVGKKLSAGCLQMSLQQPKWFVLLRIRISVV